MVAGLPNESQRICSIAAIRKRCYHVSPHQQTDCPTAFTPPGRAVVAYKAAGRARGAEGRQQISERRLGPS